MSETLPRVVSALRQASQALSEAEVKLRDVAPSPRGFGADGAGAFGELGRALFLKCQRALDARAREASAHGTRLDHAAGQLGHVVAGYADTDHQAGQAGPEVR